MSDKIAASNLIQTAATVDFKIGEPLVASCLDDGSISLEVTIVLAGDDDEDPAEIVEWAALGMIYVLALLSFHDARPRGVSGMDFVENDEFTVDDLLRHLRFENGEIRFYADYLRGRCMKTGITASKDGTVKLQTMLRGKSALRWLDKLQGKQWIELV